ncbi:hypothetical protein [Clostridium tetani]|uniref:hypothetical protein n=1 Tax=Clostridium tetani TaxID=1513 RepID=UPI000313447C|nr:hypothetical protein [Clostridium tetani]KGI36635.1 hypothetical protein KY52_12990 [Clostridium tetani]KHO30761.1 hypothetical protein OR63_13920 [Clostridium tetani]KIG19884.1 hypothetical protein RS78_12610 [Clostridium tetani]
MNNNLRLKELDILRALSFIFVVEQHSMGGHYNIKGISNLYYGIFKFFSIETPKQKGNYKIKVAMSCKNKKKQTYFISNTVNLIVE